MVKVALIVPSGIEIWEADDLIKDRAIALIVPSGIEIILMIESNWIDFSL